MTAAEIVAALEAAGARLRVVNDRIVLEAASAPPAELLDALVRGKADVLAYIIVRDAPPLGPLPPFTATFSSFAAPTVAPVPVTPKLEYSTPRFWKDRSPRRL